MAPTPQLLVLVYVAVALLSILASVGIALLWSPMSTRRCPRLQAAAYSASGEPELVSADGTDRHLPSPTGLDE